MDDGLQCDLLSIFHNITTNCSNDTDKWLVTSVKSYVSLVA